MEAEPPCGGSKSESGSEQEGSRCLDVDQSLGDFDINALSLAAGVSRGVTIEKSEAGGRGAASRGVNWVSSEIWEDGPGTGEGSLLCGLFPRLRRSLGNTGALVDVNDDEPGMGPLPAPPPSISSVVTGRKESDHVYTTSHVPDALSHARASRVIFFKWIWVCLYKKYNRVWKVIRMSHS